MLMFWFFSTLSLCFVEGQQLNTTNATTSFVNTTVNTTVTSTTIFSTTDVIANCNCKLPNESCVPPNVCPSGCAKHYSGPSCDQTVVNCKCMKDDDECTPPNPCPSGCHLQKWGKFCDNTCSYGLYIVNGSCAGECHCAKGYDACNVSSGECTDGCMFPFTGKRCQDCANGQYGQDCSLQCHCHKEKACDRITGVCKFGCSDGYTGPKCQDYCPHQHYGLNCSNRCNCLKDFQSCFPPKWNCKDGCKWNYYGDHCEKQCPERRFGYNCNKTCHCENDVKCDSATGRCPGKCKKNYMTETCSLHCNEVTFGPNCSYFCNCRNITERCRNTQGVCQSGCATGWTGATCQVPEKIDSSGLEFQKTETKEIARLGTTAIVAISTVVGALAFLILAAALGKNTRTEDSPQKEKKHFIPWTESQTEEWLQSFKVKPRSQGDMAEAVDSSEPSSIILSESYANLGDTYYVDDIGKIENNAKDIAVALEKAKVELECLDNAMKVNQNVEHVKQKNNQNSAGKGDETGTMERHSSVVSTDKKKKDKKGSKKHKYKDKVVNFEEKNKKSHKEKKEKRSSHKFESPEKVTPGTKPHTKRMSAGVTSGDPDSEIMPNLNNEQIIAPNNDDRDASNDFQQNNPDFWSRTISDIDKLSKFSDSTIDKNEAMSNSTSRMTSVGSEREIQANATKFSFFDRSQIYLAANETSGVHFLNYPSGNSERKFDSLSSTPQNNIVLPVLTTESLISNLSECDLQSDTMSVEAAAHSPGCMCPVCAINNMFT